VFCSGVIFFAFTVVLTMKYTWQQAVGTTQNLWIDEHDVDHREEHGQAGHKLGLLPDLLRPNRRSEWGVGFGRQRRFGSWRFFSI